MTEKGEVSRELVDAVLSIYEHGKIDARGLVAVVGGFDKPEAVKYLPKIVELLNGSEGPSKLVRQAFVRLLDGAGGGKAGVLTAAEMLVLLHGMEDGVGLKRAVEGILLFSFP